MDKQYLNDEFNRFFEFPTEDKSHVSSVSAKLFAEHIAYPLEREREQLRQRVAELKRQRDELLAAAEAIEIDAEECLDFDECTAMLVQIDDYHKLMEAIANVKEKA